MLSVVALRRLNRHSAARSSLLIVGSARTEPAEVPRSTPSPSSVPFASFIAEASQRFASPMSWIRAVIHTQSGGGANAVSPKGSMDLMQIVPRTYDGWRTRPL